MGSYVISVSLCTGCYRHIRISENATLLTLHKAIQNAFDFDDDHLHAFFMDNRVWSPERAYVAEKVWPQDKLSKSITLKKAGLKPGDKFKYLFDFGDEWLFQCRVLRQVEETADIPYILKSVGESPEQYPEAEDDHDDEPDDIGAWRATLPEFYPEKKLVELYAKLPMSAKTTDKLFQYCMAASRLYGVAPVTLVHELYCKYEEPLPFSDFLAFTEVARHDELCFFILGRESLYRNAESSPPEEREVIYDFLLLSGPELYYHTIDHSRGKALFMPEREELLSYAAELYVPNTPQTQTMRRLLNGKLKNWEEAETTLFVMVNLLAADYPMDAVFHDLNDIGIRLTAKDLPEFLSAYQELNNHTRKFANRGFTPSELSDRARQERRGDCDEQTSLF